MGKPKAKKAVDIDPETAEALMKQIEAHSCLDIDSLLEVLSANQAPCDASVPCKDNKKSNPNCLCALAPLLGSFRKRGLWAKEATPLSSLGDDPWTLARTEGQHCGLVNLGNTCYANAALQCIYSIPSIRSAFFCIDAALSARPIISELQQLFLAMSFGPHARVDTSAIAKVLNLDAGVQQDGQEFWKLLLGRVEEFFGTSHDPKIATLLPTLFRGGYSMVSTCQECRRQSEKSNEVTDFNELNLQVVGFKSLEDSFAYLAGSNTWEESGKTHNQVSSLEAEVVEDVNCEFCGKRTTFTRRQVLRKSPPLLCLSLQRFVFDPETVNKAKASDKITFPVSLDLGQVIARAQHSQPPVHSGVTEKSGGPNEPSIPHNTSQPLPIIPNIPNASPPSTRPHAGGVEPEPWGGMEIDGGAVGGGQGGGVSAGDRLAGLEGLLRGAVPGTNPSAGGKYNLIAVIIHKGPSASHGHYVAHIKDHGSGQWWRFDDTDAEEMGPHPNVRHTDHGVSAAAAGVGKKAEIEDEPISISDDDTETAVAATRKRGAAGGQGGKRKVLASASKGTGPAERKAATGAKREAAAGQPSLSTHDEEVMEIDGNGNEPARSTNPLAGPPEDMDIQQRDGPHGNGLAANPVLNNNVQQSMHPESCVPATGNGNVALLHSAAGSADCGSSPVGVQGRPRRQLQQNAKKFYQHTESALTKQQREEREQQQLPKNQLASTGSAYDFDAGPSGILEVTAAATDTPGTQKARRKTDAAGPSQKKTCFPGKASSVNDLMQAVTSSNAYMLLYRQEGWEEELAVSDIMQLPSSQREQASLLREVYDKQCRKFAKDMEEATKELDLRKKDVRITLDLAPVPVYEDVTTEEGYWVSTAWLQSWVNEAEEVTPIDNTSLLCCHTANDGSACMDPEKTTSAKRVTAKAWAFLQASCKGGPCLPTSSTCLTCLTARLERVVVGDQADLFRAVVTRLLESSDDGNNTQEYEDAPEEFDMVGDDKEESEVARKKPMYYVSKAWVQGWLKRSGASIKAEKSPTCDIACPHGGLLPSKQARRLSVPQPVFTFLKRLWLQDGKRVATTGKAKPNATSAITSRLPDTTSNGAPSGSTHIMATVVEIDCIDVENVISQHTSVANQSLPTDLENALDASGSIPANIFLLSPSAFQPSPPTITRRASPRKAHPSNSPSNPAPDVICLLDNSPGLSHPTSNNEDSGLGLDSVTITAIPVTHTTPAAAAATSSGNKAPSNGDAHAGMDHLETPVVFAGPSVESRWQQAEQVVREFPVASSWECEACMGDLGHAAEKQAELRKDIEAQRQALSLLAANTPATLTVGDPYYLLPRSWLQSWHAFINQSIKRAAIVASGSDLGVCRPSSLASALDSFLCTCKEHRESPRLTVKPPNVAVSKRGRLAQEDPDKDTLRIITAQEWESLSFYYGSHVNHTHNAQNNHAHHHHNGVNHHNIDPPTTSSRPSRGKAPLAAAAAAQPLTPDKDKASSRYLGNRPTATPVWGEVDGEADITIIDDNGNTNSCNASLDERLHLEEQRALRERRDQVCATGIRANLQHAACVVSAAAGCSGGSRSVAEMPSTARVLGPAAEIRTVPELCDATLLQLQQDSKRIALTYSQAGVMVEICKEEELPAPGAEGKGEGQASERKSSRSRANRTMATVSSSSTVCDLQRHIFEKLYIHPGNQRIYIRGVEFIGKNTDTMVDVEVYPGEEIRLVVTNGFLNDDYNSAIVMLGVDGVITPLDTASLSTKSKLREREQEIGFERTALHTSYKAGQSPFAGELTGKEGAAEPDCVQVVEDDA